MDLKQLHERVKGHPYRVNRDEHFKESYLNLLDKLADKFYEVIMKDEVYKSSEDMLHDFYWAIRANYLPHIERCIGVIHDYIDTGKVPVYYTYYAGVNSYQSFSNLRTYVFKNGKYYPIFTRKELEGAIEEIKEFQARYNKPISEWSLYSNENLKRFTKLLKELK